MRAPATVEIQTGPRSPPGHAAAMPLRSIRTGDNHRGAGAASEAAEGREGERPPCSSAGGQ
jgi:hypothetical protein